MKLKLSGKSFNPLILVLLAASCLFFPSCATIFGGEITPYQKMKPKHGEPPRDIRSAAIIADLICLWPGWIGLIIDFADKAIYKPSLGYKPKISPHKRDSINLVKMDSIRKFKEERHCIFQPKFFVGFDLIKPLIDENSVTIGYNITKHQFVTALLGFTYYNKSLIEKYYGISESQEDYPVFAYKGPTFRTNYNYRIYNSLYLGLDGFYKHLYYSDHTFEESFHMDYGSLYFTRNEHANVYGWHFIIGWMIYPANTKWFYINPSFGLGQTLKNRTYTTNNVWKNGNPPGDVSLGSFSQKQNYTSGIVNLIIGF